MTRVSLRAFDCALTSQKRLTTAGRHTFPRPLPDPSRNVMVYTLVSYHSSHVSECGGQRIMHPRWHRHARHRPCKAVRRTNINRLSVTHCHSDAKNRAFHRFPSLYSDARSRGRAWSWTPRCALEGRPSSGRWIGSHTMHLLFRKCLAARSPHIAELPVPGEL